MISETPRLDKASQIGSTGLRIQRRQAVSFPLHAHDYFEIEIVLRGSGTQWLNGREYPLQAGCAYLLRPADFHEIRVAEETYLWNISFEESLVPPEALEPLLAGQIQSVQYFDEPRLSRLDRAAALLMEETACGGSIQPLMAYLLAQLLQGDIGRAEPSPIRRTLLYLDAHFRESPTLAQAAEQACLSPVYFGSLFKQYTGETYINYLNARKVACAKMLLESGVSVTDACFSAGFGSLSGFLRAFRRSTGQSPDAYRRQHRRNRQP